MSKGDVLIIASDETVTEALAQQLRQAGYTPHRAHSGTEGLRAFLRLRPQAVILRDQLAGMDGWDVAGRMREMSSVPIVFLAERRDTFAMERALHVGDEYMAAPWNWQRLLAKLAALLRRQGGEAAETPHYDDGNLTIDFVRRVVTRRGQPVHLTDTEFKLLSCFVRRPNHVLTYDELLTQVWGHTHFGAKSHVSLYVRYLRKKLEDDPSRPRYFMTEWGVGYSFRPASGRDPLEA